MRETELAEIERRVLENLAQARRDVTTLTAELRSVRGFVEPAQTASQSPLHDPITGLLTADAFAVQFKAASARAVRNKRRFAVLSIYLTFPPESKDQNERDAAARMLAQRLGMCVRTTDSMARIDKDELAVLLEDLDADGQAHLVMEKLQRTLTEPLTLGERRIPLDTSVKVQVYPKPREA